MMLFEWILYMVITAVAMILLHEAGHQQVLRKYGKDATLHWEKGCIVCGTHDSYKGLDNTQLYEIYSIGVWAGFIPLLFSCILFHPVYLLLALPYIGWSWHDLRNMWKVRNSDYKDHQKS